MFQKLTYRPEIDGLRTIAIVPVIIFHLGINLIHGGYYGVDVFFVISGFLITSQIAKKVSEGRFSIINFYKGRVMRLMPALLLVILITIWCSYFLLPKHVLFFVLTDALPSIFSFANIYIFQRFGDYWGISATMSYFLHTWSLSLEEQFYLLFPLLLILIKKIRLNLLIAFAILLCASATCFIFTLKPNPNAAFYLLPYRAWELLLGGLVSLLASKIKFISCRQSFIIALLSIILILASYFFSSIHLSYWVFMPSISAALFIFFTQSLEKNWLLKIFSSSVFVFVGKRSYSLYLWHWPIILLVRNSQVFAEYNQLSQNIIALLLLIPLTLFSYAFVEQKLRYNKYCLIVCIVGLLAIIESIKIISKYVNDISKNNYNTVISYGDYYNLNPNLSYNAEPTNTFKSKIKRDVYQFIFNRATLGDKSIFLRINTFFPPKPKQFLNAYAEYGIYTRKPAQILLLGDSHACSWGKALSEVADSLNLGLTCFSMSGNNVINAILPNSNITGFENFSDQQFKSYQSAVRSVINSGTITYVVIVVRWELQFEDPKNYDNLKKFIAMLQSKGIQTIIFTQPPILTNQGNFNTSQYLSDIKFKGEFYPVNAVEQNNAVKNANIQILNLQNYNVHVFDVYKFITKNNHIIISIGKDFNYYDDDHISYQGTEYLKPQLLKFFRSLNVNNP